MTLAKDRDSWSALVAAAQRGDAGAWPPLIDRFEDLAVASAVELGGLLDEAQDIAQEAFALAFRHLGSFDDPTALPVWLLRLVRPAVRPSTAVPYGGSTAALTGSRHLHVAVHREHHDLARRLRQTPTAAPLRTGAR